MKKLSILFVAVLGLTSCKEETKVQESIPVTYHQTKKVDTVTNYFGLEVNDPYRWLEDDMSEETGSWVKAQNETTFGYFWWRRNARRMSFSTHLLPVRQRSL